MSRFLKADRRRAAKLPLRLRWIATPGELIVALPDGRGI
jgi:hypothetical protein